MKRLANELEEITLANDYYNLAQTSTYPSFNSIFTSASTSLMNMICILPFENLQLIMYSPGHLLDDMVMTEPL
jgi:hypothetical protein